MKKGFEMTDDPLQWSALPPAPAHDSDRRADSQRNRPTAAIDRLHAAHESTPLGFDDDRRAAETDMLSLLVALESAGDDVLAHPTGQEDDAA